MEKQLDELIKNVDDIREVLASALGDLGQLRDRLVLAKTAPDPVVADILDPIPDRLRELFERVRGVCQ